MKIVMQAIMNFHASHRFPTPSLGDIGNKLTYTRVKQENLAKVEIWATKLGYTWNCTYAPLQVIQWHLCPLKLYPVSLY